MSYTPTTWVKGDVITAVKLNKLEQGIAGKTGGGLIVNFVVSSGHLVGDKTFGEIWTAFAGGIPVVLKYPANAFASGVSETMYATSPLLYIGWDQTNGEADYFNGYTYVLGADYADPNSSRTENIWYTSFGSSASEYPKIYY